jgi:hypothetical protein
LLQQYAASLKCRRQVSRVCAIFAQKLFKFGSKFVAAWKWNTTKTRGESSVAAVLSVEGNLELCEHRCVFWIGAHKLIEALALHY